MYLGYFVRKWNFKMEFFIYIEKDSIYLIDLIKIYVYLNYVCKFLIKLIFSGKKILFVGIKK